MAERRGWQRSEADIEGSEYTRLSFGGLDRLSRLAHCCGDCKSGGGKQGDLALHRLQELEGERVLMHTFNRAVKRLCTSAFFL